MGTVDLGEKSTSYKLVKLRDVTGKINYSGMWSKTSRYWTSEYKKIAKPADLKDGTFYVPVWLINNLFWYYYEADYTSDLKSSTTNEKSSLKSISHAFINPAEQDVIFNYEVDPSFLYPEGCSKRDFYIYMILADG